MIERKIPLTLLLLFLFGACASVSSESENIKLDSKEIATTSTSEKMSSDCVTMNFHYLVTLNYLATPKARYIEVFLEEKAFSEENLKTLFTYISEKYPDPEYLTVKLQTNWNQLSLPSDCPGSGISNMPDRPDKYDYYQAVFHRRGDQKYFRYNPTLKTSKFKEVVMKANS